MVIIGLSADMLSDVVDTQKFFGAKIISHVLMFVCTISTALVGFLWNRFFDVVFRIADRKKIRSFLYLVPFISLFVLLIVNLFTGIFYSIDVNNVYKRGALAILSFALQYVSFAVLVLRALFHGGYYRSFRGYVKRRS